MEQKNIFSQIILGYPFLLENLACRVEKTVDPDQLASEKPADQDLHCL